jgi:3-hydroxyacyl-CoA dehydrogenase
LKLVEEGKAGKEAGEGFYINDEDKRGMERWKLEPDKELKRVIYEKKDGVAWITLSDTML